LDQLDYFISSANLKLDSNVLEQCKILTQIREEPIFINRLLMSRKLNFKRQSKLDQII